MEDAKGVKRRRHDVELKKRVLLQCAEPGVSVAQVAMAHGLNANLVHKWRRLAARGSRASPTAPQQTFMPVPLAAAAEPASEVRVELRRGATLVTVSWPTSAAGECAMWLRELLR